MYLRTLSPKLCAIAFLVCFSLFMFTQTLKHNLKFFPNFPFRIHIVRDPQSLPHFSLLELKVCCSSYGVFEKLS